MKKAQGMSIGIIVVAGLVVLLLAILIYLGVRDRTPELSKEECMQTEGAGWCEKANACLSDQSTYCVPAQKNQPPKIVAVKASVPAPPAPEPVFVMHEYLKVQEEDARAWLNSNNIAVQANGQAWLDAEWS